jgi:hypothetical protein
VSERAREDGGNARRQIRPARTGPNSTALRIERPNEPRIESLTERAGSVPGYRLLVSFPSFTNGGFEDVPRGSTHRVTDRRIARTIDRHGTASGGSAD